MMVCHKHKSGLGLYKIVVYCKAIVHESTILSFPPPTCIVNPGIVLWHDYRAVYDSPPNSYL